MWTHVHGFEDGQLQQRSRESMSQRQDEGRLLTKQLLHGVLQPQVQRAVALHEVRKIAAGLQELLHLREGEESVTSFRLNQSCGPRAVTWRCTTPCQQRAMPAMLLLLFTLGLAAEAEEDEALALSLFLLSFPSARKNSQI